MDTEKMGFALIKTLSSITLSSLAFVLSFVCVLAVLIPVFGWLLKMVQSVWP